MLVLLGLAAPGCGDPAPGAASAPPASAARPSATATATSEQPPRPASPAELAIVAPAGPGGKLADWDVRAIHGVHDGTMEVVCQKGAARVVLSIALAADGGPEPPVSTGRYAVFYSARGGATPEDAERLARALAEILHGNEAAPPPAGLGPFVPRPRSL